MGLFSKEEKAQPLSPAQVLNYVSAHDNSTLWDKLVPQPGEEAGRTKQGEDNSYNLSKDLNHLDWGRMYRFESLIGYYHGLHKVRCSFSGFYDLTAQVRKRPRFQTDLPSGVVAYTMEGKKGTDIWKKVTVVFNANTKRISYTLSAGEHEQIVTDSKADAGGIQKVSGSIQIPAISAAVFVMQDR